MLVPPRFTLKGLLCNFLPRGRAGEFDDVLRRYKPPSAEGQEEAESTLRGKALSQALEDTIIVTDIPSAYATQGTGASTGAGAGAVGSGSPLLELQDLTLFTPTYSSCLLTNLTLQVRKGEHVLVRRTLPPSLCQECVLVGYALLTTQHLRRERTNALHFLVPRESKLWTCAWMLCIQGPLHFLVPWERELGTLAWGLSIYGPEDLCIQALGAARTDWQGNRYCFN